MKQRYESPKIVVVRMEAQLLLPESTFSKWIIIEDAQGEGM